MTAEANEAVKTVTGLVDDPASAIEACDKLIATVLGVSSETLSGRAGCAGFGWPLLVFAELTRDLVVDALAAHPGDLLVHESLNLKSVRLPHNHQRFRVVASSTRGRSLGIAAEIRPEPDGADFVWLKAQLRLIDTDGLSKLRPVELARVSRGAALERIDTCVIDQAMVSDFLQMVGDSNPLHLDGAYARAAGLPGPVLPGTMIAMLLPAALNVLRPGIEIDSLSLRLLAPAFLDRALTVACSEQDSDAGRRFRLFAVDDRGQVAAIADIGVKAED